MGWLISIIMLVIGCFKGNDILVITSGLFAISGSIENCCHKMKGADDNESK